jgi:site-specific DNA recombinase
MILGIYTRVSTEEQADKGISLDNQVNRGKQLAIQNSWEYKVYQDAGLSGSLSSDKRPGLNAMMTDIANKKIDGVYVLDSDRLSRAGIVEVTMIKDIFKQNNIRYFEFDRELDLNDFNQGLLSDIKVLLDNFEIKKTGARIKSVLEGNIQKGKVSGGPLISFGYTKDANKMMVIDEDERKVVEYIYKLALEGKGTKVIANILEDEGILTKRGRVQNSNTSMLVKGKQKETFKWRDAVVYRILTNPIYKGKRLYQGKEYDCPAIVSEMTFDMVKQKLSTRNQFKDTTNKYDYLLKGLMHCQICGGRFYGHKRANGKDNTYICNSQRYSGEWCGNRGINIDWLDDFVIDYVNRLETTTERAFKEASKDSVKSRKLKDHKHTQDLLADNERRRDKLTLMYEDDDIPREQFKERLLTLNNEKEKLLITLNNLQSEIGVFNHKATIQQYIKETVSDFEKLKTKAEQKLALQNIIDRINIRWNGEAHVISVFYRLDNIARYREVSKDIYLMGTETQVERTPSNRIGDILSQKLWLNNYYFGVNDMGEIEEGELLRYINPYEAHGEQWATFKS